MSATETDAAPQPDKAGLRWFRYLGPHETVLVAHDHEGSLQPGQEIGVPADVAAGLAARSDFKAISRPKATSS
jgi:hypothetical protein